MSMRYDALTLTMATGATGLAHPTGTVQSTSQLHAFQGCLMISKDID